MQLAHFIQIKIQGYYMKGATYFICSKTMLAGRSTPVYEWEHKGDGCIRKFVNFGNLNLFS